MCSTGNCNVRWIVKSSCQSKYERTECNGNLSTLTHMTTLIIIRCLMKDMELMEQRKKNVLW